MTADATDTHGLQCMEIWGGNGAASAGAATPGLDIWVFSQPHAGAAGGGDVHYVSLCGGGQITRLIVADLSGHGETASASALKLRSLMRRNINRKEQAGLVAALNKQFLEYSQLRRFATALVATYLTTGDRLTLCNAGHPSPFRFRAATQQWELLTSTDLETEGVANLPLGIDADTPYTQRELALVRGDLLLFYTDALTESENPAGQPLGEAGLFNYVRGLDATRPDQIGPALLQHVAEHRGNQSAGDDQTVMVLHHNASPTRRPSLGESLRVYAKVLGLSRV
jgi:serine phosphatase RsbU (regulator of sigma subunit)